MMCWAAKVNSKDLRVIELCSKLVIMLKTVQERMGARNTGGKAQRMEHMATVINNE